MTTTTSAEQRVSFREVKEESYRALRARGYDWGRAQAAGRAVGVAQVLWGSWIEAVIADAKRWVRAFSRPRTLRSDDGFSLAARGFRYPVIAPLAVALTLSKPQSIVTVTKTPCVKEVATAVWDMQETNLSPLSWGFRSGSEFIGFSIAENADLFQHGKPNLQPGGTPWTLQHGRADGGTMLISTGDRLEKIEQSLRIGVGVESDQWKTLSSHARKFLVPE